MRRLFRSFERFGLEYLLISGQAAVLYGAATFSEDVDIWIRPSRTNAARLLRALASCGTKIHKLTPPLSLRNMRAGHGFHFVVPDPTGLAYLDVMARPPRVGPFESARRRARVMETDWGRVPVVAVEDLVLLKLTRRLSDYEVVSNLVRGHVRLVEAPTRAALRWAARYSFRAEDRVAFLAALGVRKDLERCRVEIARELARLQARDVRYWKRHLSELRRWRAADVLLPAGSTVASLLRSRA